MRNLVFLSQAAFPGLRAGRDYLNFFVGREVSDRSFPPVACCIEDKDLWFIWHLRGSLSLKT